jgi:hypothetical protein
MWTKVIPVMDWQTKNYYDLPRFGKHSWIQLLITEGYELIDEVQLGNTTIDLYKTENNIYAIYNPPLASINLECLLINILSEENARILIHEIKDKLSLFASLINQQKSTLINFENSYDFDRKNYQKLSFRRSQRSHTQRY